MDINCIECFLTVARTLNFSEAARRSFISQSMVSRYIDKLEKELGARLFARTSKEVRLTAEGRAFLPYASEIADNMKKARFAVEQLKSGYTGRVKIAYDTACGAFAAKCIGEFSKKYPGIAVDLCEFRGGESADGNEYDCMLLLRDMLPDSDSIDYAIIHSDTLMIAAPKSGKSSYRLSELKDERFILLSETENPILYMEIMDIFRSARLTPEIVSCPDSVSAVLIEVGAGLGITLLPSQVLKSHMTDGVIAADLTDIDTTLLYAAAWHKNSANSAAELFVEIVKKYAGGGEYEY